MRHVALLSLVVLLVVISGCVSTETTISTTDGVIITDFSFSHAPIYAGDNVGLFLEVQNVGGTTGILNKIQIYGVDFTTEKPEREWRVINNDNIIDLNEVLYPPDPDIKVEGEKYFYQWGLQAPKDISAKTKYDFLSRVEYEYETAYTGTIRVINDNYLQTLNDKDRELLFSTGGVVSSELTNGPISVIPYSGRHFVISPEDSEEDADRTIKFKIENVGKGYTYYKDASKYKDYIRIDRIISDVILSCTFDNPTEQIIKLSDGKSDTLECRFNPPTNILDKKDIPFLIKFVYSYYIDGHASIEVKAAY